MIEARKDWMAIHANERADLRTELYDLGQPNDPDDPDEGFRHAVGVLLSLIAAAEYAGEAAADADTNLPY